MFHTQVLLYIIFLIIVVRRMKRIQKWNFFAIQGRLENWLKQRDIFITTEIWSPSKLRNMKYHFCIICIRLRKIWDFLYEHWLLFFRDFFGVGIDDEKSFQKVFSRLSYHTPRFLHKKNLHFRCKAFTKLLRKRWNRKLGLIFHLNSIDVWFDSIKFSTTGFIRRKKNIFFPV